MSKNHITITRKQAQQFNSMLRALKRIREYQSPEKLRRSEETEFLGFEETITMAYENMQGEAAVVRGIKAIEIPTVEVKAPGPKGYKSLGKSMPQILSEQDTTEKLEP